MARNSNPAAGAAAGRTTDRMTAWVIGVIKFTPNEVHTGNMCALSALLFPDMPWKRSEA
jgi:hypothetical protein